MVISVIRTIILYLAIMIALRIMGKRQLSQLQPSELVITLLISDIASIPMQNSSFPLVSGIIPIIVLVAAEIVISVFMVKSSKLRRLICGRPIVVIDNGKIRQDQMKRLRMTIEDLSEQLRQMDIFDFSEVDYAIVETNGQLSVLKKAQSQLPSVSDLNITISDKGMDTVVITNGEISDDALKFCNVNYRFIENILKAESVKTADVFIMTLNKKLQYKIIKRDRY